jgi:hypothetical protein
MDAPIAVLDEVVGDLANRAVGRVDVADQIVVEQLQLAARLGRKEVGVLRQIAEARLAEVKKDRGYRRGPASCARASFDGSPPCRTPWRCSMRICAGSM